VLYQTLMVKNRNHDIFVDGEQIRRVMAGAVARHRVRGWRSRCWACTSPPAVYIAGFMIILGKYAKGQEHRAGDHHLGRLLPDVRGLVQGAARQGLAGPARLPRLLKPHRLPQPASHSQP
jgi:hypothetical protein